MDMVKWNDNFSVKHEDIDEQHKKLISIINEVAYLVNEGDTDFANFLELVNHLDGYIQEHFKYEESLMDKYSYPDKEAHINQHNDLRIKMESMNIFDINKPTDFYKDLLTYLVNWISTHVMQTDKKLGLFIHNNTLAESTT